MLELLLFFLVAFFLAYVNGANDNFKGVATLYGSGVATYKHALRWATVTTLLGSIASLMFAHGLVAMFSGKGLVSDGIVAMKSFSFAVGFAAACTVMLATRFGFPISTTHALTGALVGAGYVASGGLVNYSKLGNAFLVPLIVSPFSAVALSSIVYFAFRVIRRKLGIQRETCVCVGNQVLGVVPRGMSREQAVALYSAQSGSLIRVGTTATCADRYTGRIVGLTVSSTVDRLHYLSAGAVCFARALNDTPKIAALLLIGASLPTAVALIGIACFMVLGGLINSRKVAETMGHGITTMNAGQGFSANLVTSFLVLIASRFGLPVSTTHVSCGSLFGIAAINRRPHWSVIGSIFVAWVTTLPLAGFLAIVSFFLFRNFFHKP